MEHCAYCGAKATQRDHIPPRCLFKKPRPDLITVPSCADCNQGASTDDEYLRLVLSMRHDTHRHPDASKAWTKARRSLNRPQARGLRKETLDAVHTVNLQTESDLYIGKAGAINVDLPRTERVVERTMVGLYHHHRDQRLSDESEATAFALDGLPDSDIEIAEYFVRFYQFVSKADLHAIGDDVFTYRMRFLEGRPEAGVFFCTFYGAVNYIGFFA